MLKHTKGNLLDLAERGNFDIIVHGCNCHNTMGSGIAKEIRERYQGAYDADTLATEQWKNPVAKLGNFSTYATVGKGNPFIIVNAYTQLDYNKKDEEFIDRFEYESFYLILKKLEALGGVKFGFPRIGQGLAGGNPERINQMLSDFAVAVSEKGGTVTVVDFDGK